MAKADIGIVGLAVMGENLALNIASRGYTAGVYNRSTDKVDRLLRRSGGAGLIGCGSPAELVGVLKRPRKVFLMVRAGEAVDEMIEAFLPLLDEGDILIDGGNSHFEDTVRRTRRVEAHGMLFIGVGVSGGEEGALHGPSMMPGGSPAAWEAVKPIFQSISARAEDGTSCCDWIGPDGAGHFVKMIHNGIEYGDMQLISEAYGLMRDYLRMSDDEISEVFRVWNETELRSYLIGITADILKRRDEDGTPLVGHILDAAGQKGTGKWTVTEAYREEVPLTLIAEAVSARSLSAMKDERVRASRLFPHTTVSFGEDRTEMLEALRQSLYAAKIVSYAQGFALLRSASEVYGWTPDYAGIARLWRGGCIIRSAFLDKISEAFSNEPTLPNLLLAPYFRAAVTSSLCAWRRTASAALLAGVPVPALVSALSYFDAYTSERLPANLLQAQRDYFGAHTYERTDRPRGEFFHTNWMVPDGETVSVE